MIPLSHDSKAKPDFRYLVLYVKRCLLLVPVTVVDLSLFNTFCHVCAVLGFKDMNNVTAVTNLCGTNSLLIVTAVKALVNDGIAMLS